MRAIYDETTNQELIHDKATFLKYYPEISRNRGKGFNYLAKDDLWKSENITGLEMRISRLLGIEKVKRRFLGNYFEIYIGADKKYRWRIRTDVDQEIILNSEEGYDSPGEVNDIIEKVLFHTKDPNKYQRKFSKKKYYFNLTDETGEIIGRSQQYFDTAEECDDEIDMVMAFINRKEDEEGLHVVEHILLRPKIQYKDFLLPINLNEGENCPWDADPYSFRISVIIPAWPERFKNTDFRKFIEKKIRMETPAHVFAKICWVNKTQMKSFEWAYNSWLHANAQLDFDILKFFGVSDYDKMVENLSENVKKNLEIFDKDVKKTSGFQQLQKQFNKLQRRFTKLIKDPKLKIKKADKDMIKREFNPLKIKMKKLHLIQQYTESQENLVRVMLSLRNVYPYATLRDCKTEAGNIPVALNNTVLGSMGEELDFVRVDSNVRDEETGIGTMAVGGDFEIYKRKSDKTLGKMKIGKNFKVY
jgi:uncharacterized protein YegP (UPF0339 family)